ncbi:MAG TPA: PBP1A family penicillin-binding protein [Pseudolabrys sp.]|nr:PBP1A family penicillin-binding protein [Pseudolabrys sp.]
MASGRGHSGGRKEPSFGSGPEVRVRSGDRPGGARSGPKGRKGKKRTRRSIRSVVGRLAYWAVVLALWAGIGGIGALVWVGAHLPPIQSLEIPKRPPSIQIVDLRGQPLARRGDKAGAPIALKEMPAYVPRAFVAIEDRRFYHHFGVDPYGILRALKANILHLGVAQGGSTITQQLAKNLFLTQERTLHRKLQEALLALWLEHKYSKNKILELYLNRVYFGSGAYGIEQAAQHYFGVSARGLTLPEAAMLAGLVRSPSRLAPTRNYAAAEKRARLVLADMAELHYISKANERVAMANPPRIVTHRDNGSINYVADWVMDGVNDILGHVDQDIVVHTTIDAGMQADAERALDDELKRDGKKYRVGEGALVSMTPEGAVRALLGGRNYAESQYNRAVSAKRQPGSSFKPFVYLTALEHGLTPDSIRTDGPINVHGWRPENYEHDYLGPVPLSKALALSLNTVSVRLTLEFGPRAVIRTAHDLGIASPLQPNASIALGTSEVSLLELTGAYSTFANGGYRASPYVIARITTPKGRLLYAHDSRGLPRVIDGRYAGMMNAMLQQTLAYGTAKHASLPGWPAAGKTGTSQDFRDAWFIGYTGRLVTGVWLGNDDGKPTRRVTGGSLPVQIWSRYMREALQGVPVVGLPGYSSGGGGGGLFSGLFGDDDRPSAPPVPPQPVAVDARQTTSGNGTLDGWLIDSLFGRR